jgi:hypothetical protein
MTIEESFINLSPYIKGFKKTDNYRIMEVNLKSTWEIIPDDNIESKTQKSEGNSDLLYILFYSEKETFDYMVNWLKKNVIDYNLEIEEKEKLLKAKVEELKRVFENKSLDELSNLKFTTEEDTLKLGNNKVINNEKLEKIS